MIGPQPESVLIFTYYTHEQNTQYGFEIIEMKLIPGAKVYFPIGQRGGSGRFEAVDELVDAIKKRENLLLKRGHVVDSVYLPGLSQDVLSMAPDAEVPPPVDVADFEFFLSEYDRW